MADLPILVVGDLLPDSPDRDNPGLLRAENVVPRVGHYQPIRGLVPNIPPLTDRCRGAEPVTAYDGEVLNFAGDNTKLYELASGAYVDKSRATPYDLKNQYFWTFFGFNGWGFAVGGYETLQQFTAPTGFDDVAITQDAAPKALYADVVREFIVTGNQVLNPQEVVWSALGDESRWVGPGGDASIGAQAGRQTLQQGGPITQVVGGEYGVVFCEHAIYRMNYQGAPIVFSFDNVEPDRGTVCPGSVAQFGHLIAYLDFDGFYIFDGNNSTPIGSTKINETFLKDFDQEYPKSIDSLIDIENTTIFWSYVSTSASIEGVCDKVMAYNYATDKFAGPIHMTTEQLVYSLTPAVLTDEVDIKDLYTDTAPLSETLSDAQEFKGGGRPVMAAFDESHQHAVTEGDYLEALIETGEYSLNPGGFAMVDSIRPVVEGNAPEIKVAIGRRDQTHGDVNWTAEVAPYARTGLSYFRSSSRFQRVQIRVGGDYDKIVGLEPAVMGMGKQ